MQALEPKAFAPVSVLMSTYMRDDPQQLALSLKSISEQTAKPREVVIVIGGVLPDALEAVLADFARGPIQLNLIRQTRNEGLGAALQLGLEHCSQELVARMDGDDVCYLTRIEKQYAYMQNHPDTDLLCTWHAEFDTSIDHTNALKCTPAEHSEIARMLPWRNGISHPTIMFRKSRVLAIGGYRSFRRSEDHDLWLRAVSGGLKFSCLQEPLVYMRVDRGQRVRRTGAAYAFTSVGWRARTYREGHISLWQFLACAPMYFAFHFVPPGLKAWLYGFVRRKACDAPKR